MLESKRNICESVLNKCQATRDGVWTDFLRDIAPELKIAESKLEANMRGSCLMTISECIQTACKDNIVGKKDSSGNDVPSMDACLARPDMARSFCKVQIDPCERMEPQVWDFVVSKLAAMRVDACTEEVKQCFTSEDRCGADFSKCIGMDFKFLHDMCPVDKLIVCKQSKKDFKMADIDKMLMGFYLNVDNNALELCQKLITEKMEEVCGSTIDCNQFASDDKIGTNSLQPQKVGSTYKITGMISFGSIKIGDGIICDGLEEDDKCDKKKALPVGHVGVKDYIANVRKKNSNMGDNEGIINSIEAELNNIAGKINNTMGMIETDQKIQYCIEGRDLSQINGGKRSAKNTTTARFPNLLNNQKVIIANAAIKQANDNYNKKFNRDIAEATKKADLDIAQYMCQQIANGGGAGGYGGDPENTLAPPYSISYEVSSGISKAALTGVGSGSDSVSVSSGTGGQQGSAVGGAVVSGLGIAAGAALIATGAGAPIGIAMMAGGILGGAGAGAGTDETKSSGNATVKTRSLFSRETRNCHYCKETITQSCSSTGGTKGFLGIGAKQGSSSCESNTTGEVCEDIQM